MSHPWHSPLSSSLPYMSSVDSYTERGLMYGHSPMNGYEEEDMYRLEEEEIEIASSTEHMTSSTSSTSSTTTSDDGSDDEIDAIRRAIETTLGSADKEDAARNANPRAKYLARIGVGATRPTPVTVPSTSRSSTSTSRPSSSSRVSPRTPPTSPNDTASDDSLDAMLALMGVSDEMTELRVTRSSPIDIPRKISRPIPIPTRVSHPRPSGRISVNAWSTKTSQPHPSHGWDSDDDADESYFDSPQTEDLSGSMLFDY